MERILVWWIYSNSCVGDAAVAKGLGQSSAASIILARWDAEHLIVLIGLARPHKSKDGKRYFAS